MIEPKVVFEPVLSRWRVESRGVGRDGWRLYRYFSTLDEAREAAQRLTDDALGYKYRVVDTKPSGAQPVYTVEALRGDNSPWNQIVSATSSREAYAYAKQCAGENNLKYRVVQTDADGAKIAQEVTPDGLGDLNPLNLLWIEKAEREATAWVTDAAHPKPKPWEKAQPDEVWALTINNAREEVFRCGERGLYQLKTGIPLGSLLSCSRNKITAGRRIWPEENK